MKNKQRPEYAAWEKLTLAQIETNENGIKCLSAEIKAHRELLKCQRRTLSKARKDEAAV
jgi:hypothetical protein